MKKRTGLNMDEKEAMILAQENRCGACETNLLAMEARHRHVDHDHKTGLVRSILCHHCNVALGHVQDNPNRLRQLITYLERKALDTADVPD